MNYLKSIFGGVTAFVGALATAAADNSITLSEWLVAVGAGLAAAGVIWGVPNSKGSGNA